MATHSVQQQDTTQPAGTRKPSFLQQPKSVWAVAFACVVSFMGIGLVDPILPTMAGELHATPAQVSLLFTSYLLVTAVAMLITGWVSSRIGAKKTLITGLVIIVIFSALAGLAPGIDGIIGFRAGWGLGNALFIATSLAVIVGAASGGFAGAIMLYEAALGLGIALGPLIGGVLGGISWRGPFFGVAALMAIALVAVITLLKPTPKPAEKAKLSAPLKALRHRGLLTVSITALLYNWGFFTIMGYAPYPMHIGVHELGWVFFGWGVLVAIFAVFVAPWARKKIGTANSLYITLLLFTLDLAAIAYWVDTPKVIIICVIVSGAFIGLNNTLVTSTVMSVAPVPRPTASAAYSFVRFIGGGLAPYFAGKLAAQYGDHLPFYIGAGAVLLGLFVLATAHRLVKKSDAPAEEPEPQREQELDDEIEELLESAEGDVVHGYLTTAGGTPVPGAALTLIDSGGHQVGRGRSSHDGYYNVTGPGDGSYVLIVSAPGCHPLATPITLTPEAFELPLTLTRDAGLSGTVTASCGDPVPGAAVTLVDSRGDVSASAPTDPSGRYRITGLVSGEYTVAVSADGYAPAVCAVAVGETGESVADVELAAHAPLAGTARSASGRPITEALVTLVDAHGNRLSSALTGPEGEYSFQAVPEGEYTVIATGYPPVRGAVRIDSGEGARHDITLGHGMV
jgi:MFS family permease